MNLREKMYELLKQVRNNLNDSIGYADETQKYQDFVAAFDQIKITERRLKAVRAQVRTHMRKTKQAMQDACPHVNKVDVRVRETEEGHRLVEQQACTHCSKVFDLPERVS